MNFFSLWMCKYSFLMHLFVAGLMFFRFCIILLTSSRVIMIFSMRGFYYISCSVIFSEIKLFSGLYFETIYLISDAFSNILFLILKYLLFSVIRIETFWFVSYFSSNLFSVSVSSDALYLSVLHLWRTYVYVSDL